jgi:transposase
MISDRAISEASFCRLQKEARLGDVEIVALVERRRKWTDAEKAALLAEVEAEGGKVKVVARRHGISESLIYNWRSAWKMATAAMQLPAPAEFVPLGVVGEAAAERPMADPPPLSPTQPEGPTGGIEITLPNGARIRVDETVSEKALSRVLRALKGSL